MPKFDDDSDDDSEKQRVRIRNRKAVYKAVIKEANGKLSMSHITLEPRAQAGIPLSVKKDDVIGFCWKEETGVRYEFIDSFNSRVCYSEVFSLSVIERLMLLKCE